MKPQIIILAFALLTGFAIAQAQLEETPVEEPGCSPEALPDVDQLVFAHFYGHVGDATGVPLSHNMLSGVAKGKPGTAALSGWLTHDIPGTPDQSCPEGALRFDITSFEWGEIYEDNSRLRGVVDPGSFFCGSEEGITFEVTGTIVAGSSTGRFEGASGTWTASSPAAAGLPITLKVYCNN